MNMKPYETFGGGLTLDGEKNPIYTVGTIHKPDLEILERLSYLTAVLADWQVAEIVFQLNSAFSKGYELGLKEGGE